MLAFLDALCAALLARHSIEIYRLLSLPQAKKLPRVVREEATVVAKAGATSHIAPIQALHLYYKLSHLVDEAAEVDEPERNAPKPQIEMRLGVRKAG